MCGIIGYVGERNAFPILLSGLEKLEYRGYDSAGICTAHQGSLLLCKKEGRVSNLQHVSLSGTVGIGHTRWSTHGIPCDKNAHPFTDEKKEFSLVHNGIIENYLELKDRLRREGYNFSSDTDSEVIVHLISRYYNGDLRDAVVKTLQNLQGAYAFCVIKNDGSEIVGARNGSPLVIGVGESENFVASDVSAFINHTKNAVYVHDFEIVSITGNGLKVYNFDGKEKSYRIKVIDWDVEQAQKQGYKHFMLKEIYEQPEVIQNSLEINIPNLEEVKRIIMVACGTASYAGFIGKYIIEKVAGVQVMQETASEFRYKKLLFQEGDLVLVVSQSGETADTLAALRIAKQHGVKTLGIINVRDSTIAREVDTVIYTKVGQEIGVASTKAFLGQMLVMYKIAYSLNGKEFDNQKIVDYIKRVLELDTLIQGIASQYYLYQNFIYIGRNTNYPLALEGALKLKEISYIHAEAYPAGELKHGPIALVSEDMPTLAICPQDSVYNKTLSNIEEIKARNGKVLAIATEGDEKISKIVDDVIFVPKVEEELYPFLIAIPLQLFAYHVADLRECDIDKPRNLAKSVTVE
jgi:glutamine---fructose-6-phosphate transaminase (isomerizing)